MKKIALGIFILISAFANSQDLISDISWKYESIVSPEALLNGQEKNPKESVPDKYTLHLSDDKSFSLTNIKSGEEDFYDFKSRKIITRKDGFNTSVVSIHQVIDYREAEYNNRIFLNNMMASGGIENPFGNGFDLESTFSLLDKENPEKLEFFREIRQDTVFYSYKDKLYAKVVYTGTEISSENASSLSKFLLYHATLHPTVLEEIIEEGKTINYLEWRGYNMGETQKNSMHFEEFQATENSIPAFKTENWSKNLNFREELDPLIMSLYQDGPDLLDADVQEKKINKLIKKEKYLDAMLMCFEVMLQNGDQNRYGAQFKEIQSHIETDADLREFLFCLSFEVPEDQVDATFERFQTLINKKPASYYVMYIFYANNLTKVGRTGVMEYFEKALDGNIYITGIYHDMGDEFAKEYNFINAWKCYDIVDLIYGSHPMARSIESKKNTLEEKYPQYF